MFSNGKKIVRHYIKRASATARVLATGRGKVSEQILQGLLREGGGGGRALVAGRETAWKNSARAIARNLRRGNGNGSGKSCRGAPFFVMSLIGMMMGAMMKDGHGLGSGRKWPVGGQPNRKRKALRPGRTHMSYSLNSLKGDI